MGKAPGKELKASDAKRRLGTELLQDAIQIKSGKATRLHRINVPTTVEARIRAGLSILSFDLNALLPPQTCQRQTVRLAS